MLPSKGKEKQNKQNKKENDSGGAPTGSRAPPNPEPAWSPRIPLGGGRPALPMSNSPDVCVRGDGSKNLRATETRVIVTPAFVVLYKEHKDNLCAL